MRYYSITIKNSHGNLHAGEQFCNAAKPLSIGQLHSSDIVIPCSDDLLPQSFCIIKPNANSGGWVLIKQTDFYSISINGKELYHVRMLEDGDVISIETNETVETINRISFAFNVHDDDGYSEALGITRSKSKNDKRQMLLWCCSLLAVLAFSIGYPMLRENMNNFTSSNDNDVRASVYKIMVSEVMLQMHTPDDKAGEYHTIDSHVLDSVQVGSCFLTTDSLCVTARHCVEPWLDFNGWTDNTTLTDLPQDVYWAVLAERSQLEQSDTLLRVVTKCRIMTNDDVCIDSLTSDKFMFNRSRDIMTHMGNELLPWRIIYPLYNKKDVELGDFAFMKTKRQGTLTLADDKYLTDMKKKGDAEVRIYGFPRKNNGNLCEYQSAELAQKQNDHHNMCIQLKVNGTSGYSGSPVIEKRDGKMTVIGIFSKIDDFDESKNTFYAVPASEVSQYNPTKANEQKQYRR